MGLFLLASASAFAAEPVDQYGRPQPWRGPAENYRIIDFAASWCTPCWTTLPKLVAFATDNPAFQVIVVDVDDTEAGRATLVEGLDLRLPVLWDSEYTIAEHYSPPALPATYVLDRQGSVIYEHIGSQADEWKALIRFLETLTPDH